MLIVLGGLPGVGKTTIARELARSLVAVHLRIDSIEQALRQVGWAVEAEGDAVARAVAADNLRVGHTVVADCVNPWPLTRDEWRAVAERVGVPVVEVEVVCSDQGASPSSGIARGGHGRSPSANMARGCGTGLPSVGPSPARHRYRAANRVRERADSCIRIAAQALIGAGDRRSVNPAASGILLAKNKVWAQRDLTILSGGTR